MKNKFVTKKGFQTIYSLACGNMEVNKGYPNTESTVYLYLEHGVLQVRGSTIKTGVTHRTWESFDNLKEARECFKRTLKEYGLKRKVVTWEL